MWRNVTWNSTESCLPEGMHKHETGAYFKTPSIQSVASSQSGAAAGEAATLPPPSPAAQIGAGSTGQQQQQQQQQQEEAANASKQQQTRRQRLKESQRQSSSSVLKLQVASSQQTNQAQGFRSRLSSISGALQHPRLARRLFSGHQESGEQQQQAPIQITTTSIDSPQHQARQEQQTAAAAATAAGGEHDGRAPFAGHEPELRHLSSSSGRRLSQLFLPQLASNLMLGQDPYANNELIPPHLLGLYGQPPLVGGAGGSAAGAAHRASWADITLFGRLSNVRPSIDSAFHSQTRLSFDARK